MLVHSYHITAKNKETGELDADFIAFSEFYIDPVPKNLEFPVSGLKPGTDYEIKVQALDSFNNSSKRGYWLKVRQKPWKWSQHKLPLL